MRSNQRGLATDCHELLRALEQPFVAWERWVRRHRQERSGSAASAINGHPPPRPVAGGDGNPAQLDDLNKGGTTRREIREEVPKADCAVSNLGTQWCR